MTPNDASEIVHPPDPPQPIQSTRTTQRRQRWLHLKLAMKKIAIASLLVFTFLVVGNATGVTAAAEKVAGKLADRLVFFVHVAQLYTKEPDKKLAMPLVDVEKKQIADTWHAPRDIGRLHEGQDIFAPRGTPVFSATEGIVSHIGENSLGGQTVSILGAGGRSYYYAHLEGYAPKLAVGDYVTTKTVLGYVGTTGNAAGTPPHLHFGVYQTGGALNPLPLLNDRPKEKPQSQERPNTRTRNGR